MNNFKFLNPVNWGIVKIYRDIDNYRSWIKTIKSEENNPKSKYNIWELKHNIFYNVYLTLTIDETEANLPDNIKKLKIVESLNPIHRYFDEELGYAECLVPEFNQFVDDKGEPTLTYLVVYRFAFNKISLGWFIRWALILSGLFYFISKYDLISKFLQWI